MAPENYNFVPTAPEWHVFFNFFALMVLLLKIISGYMFDMLLLVIVYIFIS